MANSGPYRKPQADIYTLLLLLSLVAVIMATVLLYLETKDYGSPPHKGAPSVSMSTSRELRVESPQPNHLAFNSGLSTLNSLALDSQLLTLDS
jgi:hypothetical protein